MIMAISESLGFWEVAGWTVRIGREHLSSQVEFLGYGP